MTDVPEVPQVPEVPDIPEAIDANEADLLEQASPVEEGLSGADLGAVENRSLEANEADVLEQSLSVPPNEDDDLV